MKTTVICFLLGCANIVHGSCEGDVSLPEYNALYALYRSTNGSHWRWNSTDKTAREWTFPSNLSAPCGDSWQGIYCSLDPQHFGSCQITLLALPFYHLQGSLPSELANLTALRQLSLHSNRITGTIPSELGLLDELSVLELQANIIHGSIPSELYQLHQLQLLGLEYNFLTGSIPFQNIQGFQNIFYFNVQENGLTGTIPSIESWGKIIAFQAGFNSLSGRLPAEISYCSSLEFLYLNYNQLSGVVPSAYGKLEHLQYLWLFDNFLTGTLSPVLWTDETLVSNLALSYNFLSGSIPDSIQNAIQLTYLGLNNNMFNGTLPSGLGSLSQLQFLYLSVNQFSSSLPNEIVSLGSLEYLYLFHNSLTGTLPRAIFASTSLIQAYLSSNYFTGFLPTDFGVNNTNSSLEFLLMDENMISGPIPDSLRFATALTILVATTNYFSGSLSAGYSVQDSLYYFDFGSNILTGTLPSGLSNNSHLFYLSLDTNFFTGTLPSELGRLRRLEQLYLHSNSLSGTIPREFAEMRQLTQIFLSFNSLTGTIPKEMRRMQQLRLFNVSTNRLVGSLTELFSPIANYSDSVFATMDNVSLASLLSNFSSFNSSLRNMSFFNLEYVDFSANSFSGEIPPDLFKRPLLRAVSLYGNCFTGSLPETMCKPPFLEVLILEGLHQGSGCAWVLPKALQSLVKGTFSSDLLDGTVPSCVWSMPSLTTFHASGNGLRGIIGELPVESRLTNLALSYNYLSGSIPQSIQERGFIQLDLSSNRIAGTLSGDFNVLNRSTLLSLHVNRLSGRLPSSFYSATSLQVLEGNMFSCVEGHLPPADPGSETYACGSNDLNDSAYVWITLVLVCASVALLHQIYNRTHNPISQTTLLDPKSCQSMKNVVSHVEDFKSWFDTYSQLPSSTQIIGLENADFPLVSFSSEDNSIKFLVVVKQSVITSLLLLLFLLVVCLPMILILKALNSGPEKEETGFIFSTHTYQYGWTTTSAYLHGAVPSTLLLLSLIISEQIVRLYFFKMTYAANQNVVDAMKSVLRENSNSFESSVEYSRRRGHDVAREKEKGLPRFHWKDPTSWTIVMLPTFLQIINIVTTLAINFGYVLSVLDGIADFERLLLQIALGLYKVAWNAAFVPWAMKLLPFLPKSRIMTHQLFMKVFNYITGPLVATYLSDSTCLYYALKGNPAVTSSYSELQRDLPRCKTINIGTEASTYCIVIPQLVQLTNTLIPPWLYSYQCSSALLLNYVPVLIFTFTATGIISPLLYFVLHKGLEMGWFPELLSRLFQASIFAPPVGEVEKQQNRLFDGMTVVSRILLNFAVLLTFGLASPLLAVTVVFDVVSVAILWKTAMTAYLRGIGKIVLTNKQASIDKFLTAKKRLEEATEGTSRGLMRSIRIIVVVVGLFWSLMMFDMVADVYGNNAGLYAVIVTVIGCPAIFIVSLMFDSRSNLHIGHLVILFYQRSAKSVQNAGGRASEAIVRMRDSLSFRPADRDVDDKATSSRLSDDGSAIGIEIRMISPMH